MLTLARISGPVRHRPHRLGHSHRGQLLWSALLPLDRVFARSGRLIVVVVVVAVAIAAAAAAAAASAFLSSFALLPFELFKHGLFLIVRKLLLFLRQLLIVAVGSISALEFSEFESVHPMRFGKHDTCRRADLVLE